ncbi:hypothetical protein U0070_014669, partial [Myodes glareolus]
SFRTNFLSSYTSLNNEEGEQGLLFRHILATFVAICYHLPASKESSHSGHIRMPFCYKLSLLTPVLMTAQCKLLRGVWNRQDRHTHSIVPSQPMPKADEMISMGLPLPGVASPVVEASRKRVSSREDSATGAKVLQEHSPRCCP